MKLSRVRVLAAGVLLASTLAIAVGPATVASAVALPSSVEPAPDFTPSSGPVKKFMLNVLGSVLGSAMPSSWRAEQLANQYQYNHSWESLNAEFGYDSASTGPYDGMPGTYDDYVIKKTEQDLGGGTAGAPLAAPATKPKKLTKTIGAAAAALGTFSMGVAIGAGALELYGFDADGAVCGNLDGPGETLVNMLTGTDCAQFDYDAAFIPNEGVVAGQIQSGLCDTRTTQYPAAGAVGNPTCSASNGGYTTSGVWHAQGPIIITDVVGTGTGLSSSVTVSGTIGVSAGIPAGPPYSSPVSTYMWPYCVTNTGVLGANFGGSSEYAATTGEASTWSFTQTAPYGSNSTNCAGTVLVLRSTYADGTTAHYGVAWKTGQALFPTTLSSADPDRTLVCTILGSNGVEYTQTSEVFQETGAQLPSPDCPVLPAGVTPANVKVEETGEATAHELLNEDVTPEYLAWWNEYPECRTGACKLDLISVIETPGYPVSCFDLGYECDGWFESATRDTDYECHYGVHTVALSECFAYSGTFNESRVLSGAPYSDPMTGTWSGGENAPTPDAQALEQGIQDPAVRRGCTGLASSNFDPVAFVMRPVQCALEWAFVPRQTVLEVAFLDMSSAWDASFFGDIGVIVGQFAALPIYTGCDGIDIFIEYEWPVVWAIDWNWGESCSGPLLVAANTSRTISGVGILLGGVRALTWYFGGVVGFRGFGKGAAS